MANIIACIWDCDKTLVDGYMEDPIFKKYNVEPSEFWKESKDLVGFYEKQGVKVNPDTIYLNHFIHKTREGVFAGLNNAKLKEFGAELKFYKGIPELLRDTKAMINTNPTCEEYGIKLEHYVVSTGFAEVIKGSKLMPYLDGVWGCELIEAPDENGNPIISEIGYTIDNTTKTRAIFEINKGISKINVGDVNSKIPYENRRVRFENMIYIADGPSDIPAFSVVNKNHGSTFGVYPKGDAKAMLQVDQMRNDGRINMFAEADYSEGTTAYLWITEKIKFLADRMIENEKNKIRASVSDAPRHLD